MSDTEPVVLTHRREHVLVILLNREKARNAVDGHVAQALEAAIDELEGDPELRAGVLGAKGKVFCAGADLRWISEGRVSELSTERGGFAGITRRKRSKPVVAAVHGHAFAGGFEVALSCDLIVAGAGVKFGLPEVKRSLVALAGGLVRLPRQISQKLALEIALTGDPVSAERLEQAGLISRIVQPDEALAEATKIAETIAENGPLAVQAAYRIITEGAELSEEDAWKLGAEVGWPVFQSEDAKEGPRAFLEKRKPVWKGR